jgi:hypothetical protein
MGSSSIQETGMKRSLPHGWYWSRIEKAVVTEDGLVVPIVDHPLVGTEEQREALRELLRWEAEQRLS